MYILYLSVIFATEYPIPSIGSVDLVKTKLHQKEASDKGPSTMSFTYTELQALDTVTVHSLLLKKGMLLKHTEYEVEASVSHSLSTYSCLIGFTSLELMMYQ